MSGRLGFAVRNKLSHIPYLLGYTGRIILSLFTFVKKQKAARKIIIMQLLFTFIEALSIVAILAVALGSAIYILGSSFLLSFGQRALVYKLLVVIISRELGPILVAFIVTARSATAIATEIGTMVTSHQIESYISFGIDPIDYLVVPRFIGVTLSMFFLNIYFSLCGLIGPWVVSQFVNPVAASGFIASILKNMSVMTVVVSVVKSIIFGMIISIVSTYYGFNVERASTEIPVAGISAVSKSFLWIITFDVIITIMSYVL
ncbi:MAG: ABC transporter permease [Treponema sp.]|nr:ABC transporter permease [Treponema sp.]